MIEKWLVAIRDHPERPPALQRLVLHYLALRTDWRTGRGFASAQQLADDADACERTVRYATSWARRAEFLLQTRRGHRISAETVIASEWQLTQPAAECLLGQSQPANGDNPTGKWQQPNRQLEHHHQESSTSRTSPSARSARPSAQRATRRADGAKAPPPPPPVPVAECEHGDPNGAARCALCRYGIKAVP